MAQLRTLKAPKPNYLKAGPEWELKDLTDVTVVLGKNGSGKSALLRAIRDSRRKTTHYVSPERTGDISTFNPGQFAEQATPESREGKTGGNVAPTFRQDPVTRTFAILVKRGNFRDGTPPCSPSELEDLLSGLVPDLQVTVVGEGNPISVTRGPARDRVPSIGQMSSGESEVLTIGLDIATMCQMWKLEQAESPLLLLDEPDIHLHPDLQARLASFLFRIQSEYSVQILIATHSTTLLSALGTLGGDRVSVTYMDLSASILQAHPFTPALREICACLGGHALMGTLTSAPILLVEGAEDFEVWSEAARRPALKAAVIGCNGNEIIKFQRTLETVFAALSDPSGLPRGYTLRDRDVSLPAPSPSHSQEYVRFIQLACHECENLYLTDEVLRDIGTDWKTACERLTAAAASFGAKAARLRDLPNSNRKTVDLKDVIREIARIVDEKNLPWKLRVGRVLGRGRPTGMLEEYLGVQVVGALWPPAG